MKKLVALLSGLALFGVVFIASAADNYKEAAELERVGDSWKEGEPIPLKLLDYRTSSDGSCFPNPRGTEMLFGSITNYPLLWHIVLLPNTDLGVFTNAVIDAIIVGGPNRFFHDLANTVKKQRELQK